MRTKIYWCNKPILKESDIDTLERAAALKEFGDGLPREVAEREAYSSYRKKLHEEAAASHLLGMRAAQATGDIEESGKHGEEYHKHMNALGHDSMGQVPPEIESLLTEEDRKPHYKFKSHAADLLTAD